MGLNLQKDQLNLKDSRLKLINEVLAGMKVLKLYAWEIPFTKRISDIREGEVKNLRKNAKIMAISNSTFSISPIIVTIASFGVYVWVYPDRVLTADKIFVCLSLFNIMRIPLTLFPWALIETVKLFVSFNRINKFLNAEELARTVESTSGAGEEEAIKVENATFTWNGGGKGGDTPTLRNIDLKVPRGSLVAVVGMVGAGKSSLVSALLGEMEMLSGSARREESVAYVPQQAWIQNMSLRNNILFDKPFRDKHFKKVLHACALESDLEILTAGEETEIGENGINLSGGQKQRVSLARAVYSDADLYLLDDPLSAVDSHVGKHIFDKILSSTTGLLRDRTRVLVTHSVSFLQEVDAIVVMKDGEIAELGSYSELLSRGGAFAEFLVTYANEPAQTEEEAEREEKEMEKVREEKRRYERVLSSTSSQAAAVTAPSEGSPMSLRRTRTLSISSNGSVLSGEVRDKEATQKQQQDGGGGELVEEEKAAVGKVRWSIYINYFRSMGLCIFGTCVSMYVVSQSIYAINNYTLSALADANDEHPEDAAENSKKYLSIYGSLGLLEAIIEMTREFVHYLNCARVSCAPPVFFYFFLGCRSFP